MNNATPKSENTPKTKEERTQSLSYFDTVSLQNTLTLLNQLKKAGVGRYVTAEYEIKGLSNSDITWAIFSINPLYRDMEKEQDENEYLQNNPVFYLSGFTEGSENYAERTFTAGPQLELAMNEIKEVLEKKDCCLVLKKEIFFYKEYQLKIEPTSQLYKIIRTVYESFNGRSGERQYEDLFPELRKIRELKSKSDKELRVKIRQDLTSKAMGLGEKINTLEKGKRLFETQAGKKLFFHNRVQLI